MELTIKDGHGNINNTHFLVKFSILATIFMFWNLTNGWFDWESSKQKPRSKNKVKEIV